MNKRIDFSANAKVYDRRHGPILPEDLVQQLSTAASLEAGMRVLDIGAGTGRVSLALAEIGCDVVALEPAIGMVEKLRTKAGDLPVRLIAGEGGQIPFQNGYFDVVVIARLLYLTVDWRVVLHEADRVLTDGGRLLHEWGNGKAEEEWVQIREKARTLFEEAGVTSPFHPGARTESAVNEALRVIGLHHLTNVAGGPGPSLTLSEFLRRLVEGEFSYIWNVPKPVQDHCLPRLQTWAREKFDLDRSIAMPSELRWDVYRKQSV